MGIDVLVPVLGRPQNVAPLLESLAVTRVEHRVFFICSPGDSEQIAACEVSGHPTLIVNWTPNRGDYAKKINWGFEQTDAEWVFQGADDLRFYPDWDVAALRCARQREKQVIGTNDMHNPQVKRGIHATHFLIARSYIEEQGGTFDDSGAIFCEKYDHQYVDLEFCETARRRGAWFYCRNSVVEHLHPHWGLAEQDETYKKAMRRTGQDRRIYMQRMGHARTKVRYTRAR
jgi:hypothetical protein